MRPNIVILQDGKEVNEIDFGIVPVGTKKSLDIGILNKGDAILFDIDYQIPHPDVKIISSASKLNPNESETLSLEYMPSEDREEGLKIKLTIKGVYVV
jgi:hypothetical protein